jgi:hypothetical protein
LPRNGHQASRGPAVRIISPVIVCVAALAGCSGNPAAPSSTSIFGHTHIVSGAVRAGNVPVAGATVVVLEQRPPASAVTDASGHYSIRAQTAQPWGLSPLVSASKSGYFADIRFTDAKYLPIAHDTELDFELEPLTQISLGDVVPGRRFNSVCSHWGYGTGACQRFALTVPSSGILEVRASASPINFDLDIVTPEGTFAAYVASPTPSPVSVKVPVQAGLTYEIRVTDGGRRAFELTSALR